MVNLAMDSACAILNANSFLVKARMGVGRNKATAFWGESTRGSLNNRFVSVQSWKRDDRKLKSGVAYSILTPDLDRESLVSN